MAYVIVASIYLIGIWLLLYCFLPWVGKLTAIYIIHDARDRIFEAAHKCELFASTNIYRDAEYVCTVSLHILRERSYGAAVALGSDWSQSCEKSPDRGRCSEYKSEFEEVFRGTNGTESIRVLVKSIQNARTAVACRVLSGNPAAMLVGSAALILSASAAALLFLSKLLSHREDVALEDPMPNQSSQLICIPTVRPHADNERLDLSSGIRTAFNIAKHGGSFPPMRAA
jgi:hypothetical protein